MKVFVGFLICLIIALTIYSYRESRLLGQERLRTRDLSSRTALLPMNASLKLQDICAKRAQAFYSLGGYDRRIVTRFANHYDAKLNRCFVEIGESMVGGQPLSSTSLMDAFENREIGQYVYILRGGTHAPETIVAACHVTTPDGKDRRCMSEEEFEALIKPYLDN